MGKILINGNIPYNIVDGKNLVSNGRVYSPIRINCNNKEVYFNPFTYMTKERHIVLPGVDYNYKETPLPREILPLKISPSASFYSTGSSILGNYNYLGKIKAFFSLTGNYIGDSTTYINNYDLETYYLNIRRGNYLIQIHDELEHLSESSRNYIIRLGLDLNTLGGSSNRLLELELSKSTTANSYVFKGFSTALSLLAPAGDPNEGFFLDIIINCQINKWGINNNNIFGFYSARARVDYRGYLTWINSYKSPNLTGDLTLGSNLLSGYAVGEFLKSFMLSNDIFNDSTTGRNYKVLYAIWY